jgi:hypothetical protein
MDNMDQPLEASTEEVMVTKDDKPQLYKVKVDGSDLDVSLEDLLKGYEHKSASERRMRMSADEMKAAEERKREAEEQLAGLDTLIESLRGGDASRLKQLLDPESLEKLAASVLRERVQYHEMSPEARRMQEMERQLAERDRELSERDMQRLEEAYARRQEEVHQQLDTDISEAIRLLKKAQPDAEVPKAVLRQVAFEMLNGETSASKALEKAMTDWDGDVGRHLSRLDVERLKKRIPKELLKKLRDADVKDAMASIDPVSRDTSYTPRAEKQKKLGVNDYFRELEKHYMRGG